MRARTRSFIIVASVLAVGVTGCARLTFVHSPKSLAPTPATDATALEGVWAGQIWETPTDYFQGVRRVTVDISRGGVWTATVGEVKVCQRRSDSAWRDPGKPRWLAMRSLLSRVQPRTHVGGVPNLLRQARHCCVDRSGPHGARSRDRERVDPILKG
jgi:hypothetical protein